jgi:hypothetical protein
MRSLWKDHHGFHPNLLRQSLQGSRTEFRWVCYECQYPPCCICKQRPDFPPPATSLLHGVENFQCHNCRYPSCITCPRPRPENGKYSRDKIGAAWQCARCQKEHGTTVRCENPFCKKPPTDQLHEESDPEAFQVKVSVEEAQEGDTYSRKGIFCQTCLYPPCHRCNKVERPKQR